jgi:hypothetical protein
MILNIIIIALICNGLSIATNERMILYKVDIWLESKLPIWIYKPLLGCVNCMASIWGTVMHFYMGGSLHDWPIVIISAIFVNGLFAELFNKLTR